MDGVRTRGNPGGHCEPFERRYRKTKHIKVTGWEWIKSKTLFRSTERGQNENQKDGSRGPFRQTLNLYWSSFYEIKFSWKQMFKKHVVSSTYLHIGEVPNHLRSERDLLWVISRSSKLQKAICIVFKNDYIPLRLELLTSSCGKEKMTIAVTRCSIAVTKYRTRFS